VPIELSTYPAEKPGDWRGTKTVIDGVEMKEVTDIKLECPVGDIPRLTLSMLVSDDFKVKIDNAHVEYNLIVPEGCELHTEYRDGRTIYWLERKK
jgi:hypothetical protein